MKFDLKIDFDEKTGLVSIENTSMVVHCHFYNLFLLEAIETASYVNGHMILKKASETSVYNQLNNFMLSRNISSSDERLSIAADMFKNFGFGILNFENITDTGGTVISTSSHLARGWIEQMGERKKPVDYFTCGFIAGALSAAFNKNIGYYKIEEIECIVQGKSECKFEVKT